MNKVKIYVKNPVAIEAMLFDGTTADMHAVYLWIESNTFGSYDTNARNENGERLPCPESGVSLDAYHGGMIIATLEGEMRVNVGDYVIRGVEGEFYPCKPGIFAQTYTEKIQEDSVK